MEIYVEVGIPFTWKQLALIALPASFLQMSFDKRRQKYSHWSGPITGVAISSNFLKIQFLFQRHNFNVTDLLFKALEQKVVTF